MDAMRLTSVARVVARVPPRLAAGLIGIASSLAPWLARRREAAWKGNLAALRLDPSIGPVPGGSPHYHHLMLQYESLALLGGRRFPVDLEGAEHLAAALAVGRGMLIATAHVGNWYLGARAVHEETGLPVHSVAGTQMLRRWTAGLRLAYRSQGLRIHPRDGSVRCLLRALRRGEIVALHLDGDQHGAEGPAMRGIALLARRSGAPIVPVVAERRRSGRLTVRVERPILGDAGRPGTIDLSPVLTRLVSGCPRQWVLFRPLRVSE